MENNLKTMIQEIVEANDCTLYDVIWTQDGSMKILQVSILDKDGKMDLDTCAKVSNEISDKLDALDNIQYEYYLEVCSPGAERELRNDEEINAAIDSYIYVKFKDPKAGMDEVQGYLRKVNEADIVVEYVDKTRKKEITIEKDNIGLIRLSVKV
ncbi:MULTISPECIES: ribosome maturation factor RimP [Breznakia]|uniref:Ribosome maturation factor RimP n=1 Tax=Breznakia blatticola TaxID=1754012 RepID=A0A4R8A796_9FIRM|nr:MULTISPECIES: ribosome maturation factor RimP [Breznakia]MDH6366058.1 ribosome maturation factor RimP [Breznakia sp. PH1-1]MDH6403010.1 ribosome maturation factor RimP [Breznakia sp. PF1-11]MDH6410719.1 ribosome maturation factor RimP [Breznakia sp. PFB1-11]MDH6413224.1 ribosome maturation factor RimP [Breznakia sp. PFB1-14]MDH6415592.1 ribosome maturation factor RimP [Breznakia sp. PFB1-4]